MATFELARTDDPRVADYRALAEPAAILAQGLFVAEGRLVVQRLVDDGRYTIRSLLLSRSAFDALQPSLASLDVRVPVYVCAVAAFAAITGFNIHRGCLALAERPARRSARDAIGGTDLVVVLEKVANADNVGGVFRNAAAFGAGAVLLSPGCCDPLYRKAIRTSMAASLTIPFASLNDWPEGLRLVRDEGFALVALTPHGSATPIDRFAATRPKRLAVLVGAEEAGLSEDVEAVADHRVRIPIRPEIDSLNLAVATGIALSRLSRLTNLADLA
jgi:tRNA G18 (ribose-2'-O)-methylase SpoU